MRVRLTVRNDFASDDLLALEHIQVAPFRNKFLKFFTTVIGNDQTSLAFRLLAKAHGTRVFGHDGLVLGLARFEEIGDTRQTTSDVASLR